MDKLFGYVQKRTDNFGVLFPYEIGRKGSAEPRNLDSATAVPTERQNTYVPAMKLKGVTAILVMHVERVQVLM
jgi:hypothetical protein